MFDVTVSGRVAKNPELKDLGDGKKAEFISQCINKGNQVVVKGFGLNREERKDDKLMYSFRFYIIWGYILSWVNDNFYYRSYCRLLYDSYE